MEEFKFRPKFHFNFDLKLRAPAVGGCCFISSRFPQSRQTNSLDSIKFIVSQFFFSIFGLKLRVPVVVGCCSFLLVFLEADKICVGERDAHARGRARGRARRGVTERRVDSQSNVSARRARRRRRVTERRVSVCNTKHDKQIRFSSRSVYFLIMMMSFLGRYCLFLGRGLPQICQMETKLKLTSPDGIVWGPFNVLFEAVFLRSLFIWTSSTFNNLQLCFSHFSSQFCYWLTNSPESFRQASLP